MSCNYIDLDIKEEELYGQTEKVKKFCGINNHEFSPPMQYYFTSSAHPNIKVKLSATTNASVKRY